MGIALHCNLIMPGLRKNWLTLSFIFRHVTYLAHNFYIELLTALSDFTLSLQQWQGNQWRKYTNTNNKSLTVPTSRLKQMGTTNIISVAIFGASMPCSLTEFLECSCSKVHDVYSSVIGSVFMAVVLVCWTEYWQCTCKCTLKFGACWTLHFFSVQYLLFGLFSTSLLTGSVLLLPTDWRQLGEIKLSAECVKFSKYCLMQTTTLLCYLIILIKGSIIRKCSMIDKCMKLS